MLVRIWPRYFYLDVNVNAIVNVIGGFCRVDVLPYPFAGFRVYHPRDTFCWTRPDVTCLWKAIAGCLAALAGQGSAVAGERHLWTTGAYSFSDELGGFQIRAVSGIGSKQDPFLIEQEMFSASPVTLVIRVRSKISTTGQVGRFATGMMHMKFRTLNNSGIAWTEYEFELQEQLGIPSVHGDGLSFDQRRVNPENRSSDSFRIHDTDFDPNDRLVFSDGHVDPLETADFKFFVTDFTPKLEFYIRQDPRIPVS
jgi:hypothetical protein